MKIHMSLDRWVCTFHGFALAVETENSIYKSDKGTETVFKNPRLITSDIPLINFNVVSEEVSFQVGHPFSSLNCMHLREKSQYSLTHSFPNIMKFSAKLFMNILQKKGELCSKTSSMKNFHWKFIPEIIVFHPSKVKLPNSSAVHVSLSQVKFRIFPKSLNDVKFTQLFICAYVLLGCNVPFGAVHLILSAH